MTKLLRGREGGLRDKNTLHKQYTYESNTSNCQWTSLEADLKTQQTKRICTPLGIIHIFLCDLGEPTLKIEKCYSTLGSMYTLFCVISPWYVGYVIKRISPWLNVELVAQALYNALPRLATRYLILVLFGMLVISFKSSLIESW